MPYFIIIIILFFIDLFSKKYIKTKYPVNKKVNLYKNNIHIIHIKNEGFAYGFLKSYKKLIYIIMFICLIIICFLFKKSIKENDKLKSLAFSIALGGALGNFYDRIKHKNITDFISINSKKFKNLPIFNLADIFLFISPILVFISTFIEAIKEI